MTRATGIWALGVCILPSLYSQTNFGQLNGTVIDPSGNMIAGAKVEIRNLDAAGSRDTVTTGAGVFSMPLVPPGRYSLTVSAAGFQTYVANDFRLQVNESRTFEVRLQIGQVSEKVEVSAAAVAVNQTDATIGTVIQQQEIVEIPLNGRNFAQLLFLAPGTSPAAIGQQQTFGITGGFSPAINGLRHMMNNFTLDGVENNMRFTNSFGTPPPPDALEEFKVSSHQSDAAASLAAGANVNLVTRAGTNQFHGALWDFVRNDKIAANGFFNNLFGRGKLPFRQNQFGFFLGGPVYVPHLFNGAKTGTYISGYYEGTRLRRSSTTLGTVPSDAVRGGDFSELLGAAIGTDCLGRPVRQGQIYDPSTTRAVPGCAQGNVRDPYPNNRVPGIHKIAQAWMQFIYPRPNAAGTPNLILAQSTRADSDQWGTRVDQNISARQRLFGRISMYDFSRLTPSPLPANIAISSNKGANLAVNYNFIFSPTLLYEFAGGYNRATIPFGQVPLGKSFRDAVGENFSPEVPLGFLPSTQNLTGSRYNSASFVSYDLANPDDAFQFNNSLKKVSGKHSFSFGFNLLHWRHFVGVQGTSNMQYSPLTTGLPGFTATGESLASFFIGLPTQTSFGFGVPKKTHGNIYVGFAGDTWKLTPKLTVTLGLQYVYASPPTGNQVSAMDIEVARTQPQARDFTFAYIWAEKNPITGAQANASRGLLEPDRNNLAPRFAVAFAPMRNTSFRAGFGLFYDYNTNLIQNNNARGFAYPFAVSRVVTGQNLTAIGPQNPPINLDSPYVPFTPSIAQFGAPLDRYRRDPYAMNWNFGIEQLLPGSLLLGVDYVGSGGRKLSTNVQLNQAPVGVGDINSRRPWPNAGTNPFIIKHIGNSNYHSLQTKLERRFSKGLTFRNSYTWSRTLDYDSDPNSAQVSYTYNLRYSYGPATFHIPHVNVTSFVYSLPFGKGRRFAADAGRAADLVIGGWQVAGIVTIRAGQPYHILSGLDTGNTGNSIASSTERADVISPPVPAGFSQVRERWFDPNAFRIPTSGTLGNLSRDSLTGPSFQNVDMNLSKDFRIHERLALELRGEFFNLFNHTNFGNPGSSLANRALLGTILSSFAARDIQFALKLHW